MPLSDEWDALDAYLIGEESPHDGDLSPLMLDGQESADRALRRLARLDREERDVKRVAQAERDRIAAWEADRLSGIASRRSWVSNGLEAFLRALNATTGTKSLSLPWGTIRLRKRPPSVVVTGAPSALPVVLTRVSIDPDKAAIKTACAVGPKAESMEHAAPGTTPHLAVDASGAVVEGVLFLVPDEPGFSATPTEVDP